MNWKDYEKEILSQFQEMYPAADITFDAKIKGRYSNIERQIDVLIEDYAAGENIRIMVDAKYFSRNVDVKGVESFIGMMEDVCVDKGLLITQKGYSDAAINRAHNDPRRIELDILNFEELRKFQGFVALPYSGEHGVILPSPFGWIIDAERRHGTLATLYQRGLTFDDAVKRNEWMYINIFSKTKDINSLDIFLKTQELRTLDEFPKAKINYRKTIKRNEFKTLIREIEIDSYPTIEYTAFVESDDSIFFCVLFTPDELKEKNIKKLQYIISRVKFFNIDTLSMFESELNLLKVRYEQSNGKIEKAEILIGQGNVFIKLKRYKEAEEKFNDSLSLLPTCYGALKGKIELFLLTQEIGDKLNNVIDDFFDLEPTNPIICQDLMELYEEHELILNLESVMLRKVNDYKDNPEVIGNIYYHLGLLFSDKEYLDKNKTQSYFVKAKNLFSNALNNDHMVFGLIEENLQALKD
jgi:tetratricopeptide (TPR) repeat protein